MEHVESTIFVYTNTISVLLRDIQHVW